MSGSIDRFIRKGDVREGHETIVRAPAPIVFDVAEHFELQSIPIVRAIFWLRAKLLGAPYVRSGQGLVEETTGIGWGRLTYTPGREIVMGAVTQPWFGEVTFRPIPPDNFAAFNEPDLVKIVWTLEAEPLGPELTRFTTQTRVLATDDGARAKFKAYWRKFGVGILMIRWLALPAMRREAERRYRTRQTPGAAQDQASDDSARASGNRSGNAKGELHERFMDLALDEARRAAARGEVPVGAVVVADGEIVGRGFNQPIGSNDPTAHAEIVALRAAARACGNYRLTGSTLYVTVEPCLMCVGAMVHARIGRLVYGADEPKSGAIRSAAHALELPGLNHQFEVITGPREEACRELIQGFFRQKRKEPEEEAGPPPPGSARSSGRP